MYDLIIRNAQLDNGKVVDIGVKGSKIREISKKIKTKTKIELDAENNLVTPTFIDPHIHLDKCLISDYIPKNVSGTLREAIELTWDKKKKVY